MSPFISVVEASVSGRSGGGVEAAQLDAGWLERCHRNAATSHPHNRRHLSVAKGPEDGIWPDLSGSSGRACVCVCVCPSSVVASREWWDRSGKFGAVFVPPPARSYFLSFKVVFKHSNALLIVRMRTGQGSTTILWHYRRENCTTGARLWAARPSLNWCKLARGSEMVCARVSCSLCVAINVFRGHVCSECAGGQPCRFVPALSRLFLTKPK